MSTATDDLITAYLAELADEAARLPWNARTELLEDVRSHIEVALAEMREAGDVTEAGAAAGLGDGLGVGLGAGLGTASTAGMVGAEFAGAGVGGGGDGAGGEAVSTDGLAGAGLPAAGGGDAAGDGAGGEAASAVARSAEPSPSARIPADELSQVRAMLAALGEPREIVAAALADDLSLVSPTPAPAYAASPVSPGPPHALGTLDVAAVTLLLLGGFLAGIGWLVGAVLLWTSPRWSRLEKLIGTLILPGGIAGGLFALTVAHSGSRTDCTADGPCVTTHAGWNPPGWLAALMIAVILAAPAATAVYLVNRARLRPGPAASRAVLAVMAGVGTVGILAVAGLLVAATTSSSHGGHATPLPSESSSWSGYAAPISSPAPPSSSASAP